MTETKMYYTCIVDSLSIYKDYKNIVIMHLHLGIKI